MALDLIARKERETLSIETPGIDASDNGRTPEEELEHQDKLQQVHKLFQALPEAQRTAMQLRDIEGLSYAEAAEAMQLSEAAFKVTLHRARKTIKAQYEKIDNYGL